MVAIFYKWILGDNGVEIPYDVEEEEVQQEEIDEEGKNVCYISNLPLLRKLTEELPPEPTTEEAPQITEGGT